MSWQTSNNPNRNRLDEIESHLIAYGMTWGLTREQSLEYAYNAPAGRQGKTPTLEGMMHNIYQMAAGQGAGGGRDWGPIGRPREGAPGLPQKERNLSNLGWAMTTEAHRAYLSKARPYQPGDPLDPGEFAKHGSHTASSLYTTFAATPWPTTRDYIQTGQIDPSKAPKRANQMYQPYQMVRFGNVPWHQAPFRAGPTARVPERGQVLNTAVIFGGIMPEGQMIIDPSVGAIQDLAYKRAPVPAGVTPELTAQRGQTWGPGERIRLFEGHAGWGMGSWEQQKLIEATFTPGAEGEKGYIHGLFSRQVGLGSGVAMSSYFGKHFAVAGNVGSFLGEQGTGTQAVFPIKSSSDLYGLAYAAYSAMTPQQYEQVVGEAPPRTWQSAADKLVQVFTGQIASPALQTFQREQVLSPENLQMFQEAGRVVGDPSLIQSGPWRGRYRANVEFQRLDLPLFYQVSREGTYPARDPRIGAHTLASLERNAPITYQNVMFQSRGRHRPYYRIWRAHQATMQPRKAAPMPGTQMAEDLPWQTIQAKAVDIAKELTGANAAEQIQAQAMRRGLMQAVVRSGVYGDIGFRAPGLTDPFTGDELSPGQTFYFPNPRFVPRVKGTMEWEAPIEYEKAYADLMVAAREHQETGDTTAYQKALFRAVSAQEDLTKSFEFFRKAQSGFPKGAFYGPAIASYANRPEEIFAPLSHAARVLGIEEGSKAYEKFAKSYGAGKKYPVHVYREPTMEGENVALTYTMQDIRRHPEQWAREANVPVISTQAAWEGGGDLDKDDYFIMQSFQVTPREAKRIKAELRSKIVSAAAIHPAGQASAQREEIEKFATRDDVMDWLKAKRARISIPGMQAMYEERERISGEMGLGFNLKEKMMLAATDPTALKAAERLGAIAYMAGQDFQPWPEQLERIEALSHVRPKEKFKFSPKGVFDLISGQRGELDFPGWGGLVGQGIRMFSQLPEVTGGKISPMAAAALITPADAPNLREQVSEAIAAGDSTAVSRMLEEFWGPKDITRRFVEETTGGRFIGAQPVAKAVRAGAKPTRGTSPISPLAAQIGEGLLSVSDVGRQGAFRRLGSRLRAVSHRMRHDLNYTPNPLIRAMTRLVGTRPSDPDRPDQPQTGPSRGAQKTSAGQSRAGISAKMRNVAGSAQFQAWVQSEHPEVLSRETEPWMIRELVGEFLETGGGAAEMKVTHPDEFRNLMYSRGFDVPPGGRPPGGGQRPTGGAPGAPGGGAPGGGPPGGGGTFTLGDFEGPLFQMNFGAPTKTDFGRAVRNLSEMMDKYTDKMRPAVQGMEKLDRNTEQLASWMDSMRKTVEVGLQQEDAAQRYGSSVVDLANVLKYGQATPKSGARTEGWSTMEQTSQLLDRMKRIRLGLPVGAEEEAMARQMGVEGYVPMTTRIGQGIQRLAVGWTPMQMRRVWNMFGGGVFSQMIPQAAQAEMSAWQAVQAMGGVGGLPEGVAGGVMRYQAATQQAMIAGGRAGYRAWGASPLSLNALREAQGVVGPAIGAGLVTSIGLNALGPVFPKISAMAGPAGLAVAGGVALAGGANYLASFGAPTAENQILATTDVGATSRTAAGAAFAESRSRWGLPDTFWGNILAAPGAGALWVTNDSSVQQRERELRQPGFRHRGMPLSELGAQQRMGALNFVGQQLRLQEGSVFEGFDEGQIAGAVGQLFQYYPDMTEMSADQMIRLGLPRLANVLSQGFGPERYDQLAGQLGLGTQGAAALYGMIGHPEIPAATRRRWESGFAQYAPLRQFGADFMDITRLATNQGPLRGQGELIYNQLIQGDPQAWSWLVQQGGASPIYQTRGAFNMPIGTRSFTPVRAAFGDMRRRRGAFGLGAGWQGWGAVPGALMSDTGGQVALSMGTAQLDVGGFWGLEDWMRAENQTYADWQYGFQREGLDIAAQYQHAVWGVQDRMTAENRRHQRAALGISGAQIALSDRQFREQWAFNREQQMTQFGWQGEDIELRFERAMVGLTDQLADLNKNFGRQGVKFGWAEEDILASRRRGRKGFEYAEQDLTIGFERQMTQFGWAEEDLAFQRQQGGMRFGWQMEDFDEAIRFATGRQRKQLMRQRERATMMYGMQEGRFETEEDRLQTRREWAEEDYEREMDRLREKREYAEEDWQKELERLNVRRAWADEDFQTSQQRLERKRGWMEEDYEKEKERHDQRLAWAEERFDMQLEHHEERIALQKASHGESMRHLEAQAELEDELRELQREQWQIQHDRQVEALEHAEKHRQKIEEIQSIQISVARGLEMQQNILKEIFSLFDPDGSTVREIMKFIEHVTAYMQQQSDEAQIIRGGVFEWD